ncbi:N-glycosylase/DNA lyase [Thermococcus sp. 18S1]|uniref:N-glycosylase/DNA lyase n=1 Tax=Thermococcus sp. 18S1 TaxID=1638210 RepID=UPI00143C3BC8|nr:N-glycosylase/DNA lyase [Thermococcus sp. 18S1]NJE30095.1 N-glycosylase/DNA lyase [Thermococcus sp. 18S1]
MDSFLFSKTEELGKILSTIPIEIWNKIVENEPEAKLADQLPRYRFGKFATLMVMTGLNDYQLKGPAEEKYWPSLHRLIKENPVPETPEGMKNILSKFYTKERLKKAKLQRLDKFLDSYLAQELWTSNPEDVSNNFKKIWTDLSRVMKQKKSAKTIVFAMKTLGITLILVGYTDFDFSGIPIPVDVRVKRLTSEISGKDLADDDIRRFWNEVLREIKKTQPKVNMIHLDSLVWQIGQLKECKEIGAYFQEFSIQWIGQKICRLIKIGDYRQFMTTTQN